LLLRRLVGGAGLGNPTADEVGLADDLGRSDGGLIGIGGERSARVVGVVAWWPIDGVTTGKSRRAVGAAVRRR